MLFQIIMNKISRHLKKKAVEAKKVQLWDYVNWSDITPKQIKSLVHKGADVNAKTAGQFSLGDTMLMHAACAGNISAVETLIQLGAQVNTQNALGDNALTRAVSNKSKNGLRLCQSLIRHGADVNLKSVGGHTVLSNATAVGRADICRVLLESGADVDVCDELGQTPLMIAAKYDRAFVCRLLLEHGANVDAKKYLTPLMYAACYGNTEVCHLLLKAGAQPNIQDAMGKTAAHYAAENNYPHTALMLIKNGIDADIRDNLGHAVRTYLIEKGLMPAVSKTVASKSTTSKIKIRDAIYHKIRYCRHQ